MSDVSQIQTTGSQRDGSTRATLESLVVALRETEQELRASILAEEDRTCLKDENDPRYSTLARSMRSRADNLRMTVATLLAARAAA